MELTKGQQDGLEIACRRYKEKAQYTVIAGYAGTGKTTLVHFIIQELGLNENQVDELIEEISNEKKLN